MPAPFSEEEQLCLKQPVVRTIEAHNVECAIEYEVKWAGWYTDLFPWRKQDASPACVADVHTCPPSELPGLILHVATGPVALALIVISGEQSDTVCAGPAFTYYEMVTDYPKCLTDEDWNTLLHSGRYPAAPEWTESFRWSDPPAREELALPGHR